MSTPVPWTISASEEVTYTGSSFASSKYDEAECEQAHESWFKCFLSLCQNSTIHRELNQNAQLKRLFEVKLHVPSAGTTEGELTVTIRGMQINDYKDAESFETIEMAFEVPPDMADYGDSFVKTVEIDGQYLKLRYASWHRSHLEGKDRAYVLKLIKAD